MLEITAYLILAVIFIVWLIAIVVGTVMMFPFGLIGFFVLIAIGLLVIKVLRERAKNAEDDYYAKNIDQ